MQVAIQAIKELAAEVGKPRWDWQPPPVNEALIKAVEEAASEALEQAYSIPVKQERQAALEEVRKQVVAKLVTEDEDSFEEKDVLEAIHKLEAKIVRERILSGQPRIDGRDTRTIRPISIKVGLLP